MLPRERVVSAHSKPHIPARGLLTLTWGLLLFWVAGTSALASSLRISAASPARSASEVEADYTTSHLFLDETAHPQVPITVFFDPQIAGVQSAEVFTNLNHRNRATTPTPDGSEEGIHPPDGNTIAPGDDGHYYAAYPMQLVEGGYQLTLQATECGVFRITARYRLNTDAPGHYRWYGSELNPAAVPKRDHILVISPETVRNLRLYEANPLTILATGDAPQQRGTLADLANGLAPPALPRFSLQYLKALGANTLWLQPVHPRGLEARSIDPTTQQPYPLGSPYSVKNFFAIAPLLAKGFTPGDSPQSQDTPAGRTEALREFRDFVRAADKQQIAVMVDAPFNHAAHDVELSSAGQQYWGGSSPTAEIRTVEPRVFSRAPVYDERSTAASMIAVAPDRYDFARWNDVYDLYFGRYAALVVPPHEWDFRNEGDWFDYSIGAEESEGMGNGHFDQTTMSVWRYFAEYLQYWLTQTGYPANTAATALPSQVGIDGIRADFAQGLPPQCWEYIINRTRARKWNFVFLAESLDGGPVSYRSARHFDVINENLIYQLYAAQSATDFRRLYDERRQSYGATLILLNTSSQDEDNYKDPFEALLRFAANSTMEGVTMVFPGQELGLRGTIVPPNSSQPSQGPPFGYDVYMIDSPTFPKPIPSFMTYNSLMPLWRQLQAGQGNAPELHALYADINQAREHSPALRSPHRTWLNLRNHTPHQQIFSVAKLATLNADPAHSDVIFAFVSLTASTDQQTQPGNGFDVNIDADHDGRNDFGIQPDRLYNVRNLAAYTGVDPQRPQQWLWSTPRSGSDLLQNGIPVKLNKVPTEPSSWSTVPWEPLYLKLFDVTPAAPQPAPH
jgi:glycosidase